MQRDRGSRSRLIAANAAAQEFYAAALQSEEAAPARQYLTERNFDAEAAAQFGCGYAPSGWDTLTKHLLRKGFEFKELEAAGLSREGSRGPMDRFHRRLLWPIRAQRRRGHRLRRAPALRRRHDGRQVRQHPGDGAVQEVSVLFGLDLAKRDIAKGHQAVVVEGYTDVMAMHLAGVTTAVASCGTAFGEEHLSMLRRLMMDDNFFRGELIYTFDGDAAGQAAAVKAFEGEQNLAGQSFVAVADDGMDPCELRLKSGDGALRDLVARRTPMFEFVIRAALPSNTTWTKTPRAGGRSAQRGARGGTDQGLALRDEYARQLAGWVGWDDVPRSSAGSVRRPARSDRGSASRPDRRRRDTPRPDAAQRPIRGPALWPQREALKAALQYPALAGPVFDSLTVESFTHPGYAAVRAAIAAAGGTRRGSPARSGSRPSRAGRIAGGGHLVNELAVEPIRVDDDDSAALHRRVLARLQEVWVGRQIAELKSKLQRMSPAERATSTTRCSATWSRWRPTGAACWSQPAATTLLRHKSVP